MGIQMKDALLLLWRGDFPEYDMAEENTKEEKKEFYLEKKDLYIDNGSIVGIGERPPEFHADKILDGTNRLVMPGLINCHTHAYMTIFRNCADDLSFPDWLFGNISPLEDKLVEEDAYWGAKLAIMEMIRSGTTCFTDMHMNIHQTCRAVAETGIRAVITRGLVGDGEDEGGKRRIGEALEEMERWKQEERLSFMLAPHAPYTCSQKYLSQITQLAKEHQVGIHIHLSESQTEMENMRQDHDCTPIDYVKDAGIFEVPVLAAHCVNLNDSDRQILKEANASIATNPVSNMKLGNGFADVEAMLEAGINVCIGTDGAASNNSLNMFHEMNMLGLIHKGNKKKAQCISAMEVLRMATINGAKALGMEDKIGSIRVGKRADLIMIDLNAPQLRPLNDPISSLVYSANGSEVSTVMVDGRILMEDGVLCDIDADKIYQELEDRSGRIGARKTGGYENEQ